MRALWGRRSRCGLREALERDGVCFYSIASEFGCDIGIDMFWASRTTVVYCGMKAIWHTMIGVVGIFRFTSKESMTMLASCFLPASEADRKDLS